MDSIVVASLGRSGSTVLYRALVRKMRQGTYRDTLDMKEYESGTVYKTHDLAPSKLPKNVGVIFTYTHPHDIVRSVLNREQDKGTRWVRKHFEHLKADFSNYKRILEFDALNLEQNFESWYKSHDYPVMCIKYEAMWDNIKAIRKFTGLNVELPAFKPRKDLSHYQFEGDAYDELIKKIQATPDYKIW